MTEGAKYCQWCGTRRGEGTFLPYYNDVQYYYGSPTIVDYKCSCCGNDWEGMGMDVLPMKYCPVCGNEGKEKQRKDFNMIRWSGILDDINDS